MAKKAKAKKAAPKKGTYYERNRKAMRAYQQQRRADIKAGKIVPKTGVRSGKHDDCQKVVGDLSSTSPEARAIYKKRTYQNNREKTLKKQKEYDAIQKNKKRLGFIEYYNKKYPPPKPD